MAGRIWGDEPLNLRLVTVAHFYFTVWSGLNGSEREAVVRTIHNCTDSLGVPPAIRERLPGVGGRKRKREVKFVPPEEAVTYIERVAGEQKQPEKWRAALYLMYTCGLSHNQIVSLKAEDFIEHSGSKVLLGAGYVYVLTPTVREIVEQWLAITATPERPFGRMLRGLETHTFLSGSYEHAKSN